jgi:hypothetical protein
MLSVLLRVNDCLISYVRYSCQDIVCTKWCRLTHETSCALSPRVGRKKQFEERLTLPMSAEMLARIDASLDENEVRLDLIRFAIEQELIRRGKGIQPPTASQDP